jgi:hypothetical protein
MEKELGRPFGYTAESLKKLEDILRAAKKGKIDNIENLLTVISCFFGECFIQTLGGEWQFDEEVGWVVAVDDKSGVCPFTKVRKFYESGESDSFSSMFKAFPIVWKRSKEKSS